MQSGTIDLSGYVGHGVQLLMYERRLEKLIGFDGADRVTTILVEQQFSSGHQAADHLLLYLFGLTQKVAESLGCECYSVPIGHWRSKFLGPGWAQIPQRKRTKAEKAKWRDDLKAAAMRRCELIGHDVNNHNEAESVGIYYTGILKWAPPGFHVPAAWLGPLFEQRPNGGRHGTKQHSEAQPG